MIADAHGRQRKALVVTLHPFPVIVTGARKADHLPGRHVLIPTVNRIGKKALMRVREKDLEEVLTAEPLELHRAMLEAADEVVLPRVGKVSERLAAEFVATVAIQCGQGLPIVLRRR